MFGLCASTTLNSFLLTSRVVLLAPRFTANRRRKSLTEQDYAQHRNTEDLTYERVAGSVADRRAAKARGKDRQLTEEEVALQKARKEKAKEETLQNVRAQLVVKEEWVSRVTQSLMPRFVVTTSMAAHAVQPVFAD